MGGRSRSRSRSTKGRRAAKRTPKATEGSPQTSHFQPGDEVTVRGYPDQDMNGRKGKVQSTSAAYVIVDLGNPHGVLRLGPAKISKARTEQTPSWQTEPPPPQPPMQEMKEEARTEEPLWPPQPRLAPEAAPPSLRWLRDPANITEELIRQLIADEGSLEEFVKQLKCGMRRLLDKGELGTAGIAMLSAHFAMTNPSEGSYQRLRETGRNGLKIFEGYPEDLENFLQNWPETTKLIGHWCRLPCLHSTQLLAELAHALTSMGDLLPAKQLTEALKLPENPKKLQEALMLAASVTHADKNRAGRLKRVAETLLGVPEQELVQKLRAAYEDIKETTVNEPMPERDPSQELWQPESSEPPPTPSIGGTDTEATPVRAAGNKGKSRGSVGRGRAKKQAADPAQFAAQRQQWPPLDPKRCCADFKDRRKNPKSGKETTQTQWIIGEAISGTDDGTYRFARELAKAGIFVNIVYVDSSHMKYVNAFAGLGTPGQSVIYLNTVPGTILWTNLGRIYSPNGRPPLQAQLRVIFEPFQPREEARTVFNMDGEEDSSAEHLDFEAEHY